MVSVKVHGKAQEQKSGFEPYDGPEPTKRGFYRGIVKKMQFGKKNTGSTGFFIVVELEAQKGDPKQHARFDGYPMFSRNIITESSDGTALKEGAQRNLDNLLAALNTGDDPAIILGKDGDHTTGMVDVVKIGGKNPIGAVVNIDMNFERTQDGSETRPAVGGIYRFKEESGTKDPTFRPSDEDESEEEDESDLLESGGEEASEVDERAAELEEMGIAALRTLAKELGIKSSGVKATVIEAILDAEFPPEDEDESDDEDAEEADEEEEESEEEAEEDEEEGDEDEQEARREELSALARPALKTILKAAAPDFKVFTRHTDDDLRDAIIDAEFGEDTPF